MMKMVCVLILYIQLLIMYAVAPCSEKCHCPKEDEAICQLDSTDESLPKDLPSNLKSFWLRGGSFQNFNSKYLADFTKLEKLSLISNFIKRITPYTFSHFTELKQLRLEYNLMSTLHLNTFAGLKGLKSLEIPDNGIEIIHKFAFNGSRDIKELEMRYNPVHTVKSGAFSNLEHVGYIRLPHNMTNIEPNAFQDLKYVHFLEFQQWHAARSAYKGVVKDTFNGLSHVTSLLISKSHLGTIYPLAFNGMSEIGTMSISMSRINLLDKRSFAGVKNLKRLELERNEIQNLDKYFANQFRNNMTSLFDTEVVFIKNRFECDCSNLKVLQSLSRKFGDHVIENNYCISYKEILIIYVFDDFRQNCTNFDVEDIDYDSNGDVFSFRKYANLCHVFVLTCLLLYFNLKILS